MKIQNYFFNLQTNLDQIFLYFIFIFSSSFYLLILLGLVKSIGVSNSNSAQIDDLIKRGMTIPVVNQVESHPYLSQEKLLNWCRQKGIRLTAFSPLARTGTAEKKN